MPPAEANSYLPEPLSTEALASPDSERRPKLLLEVE
jgi:hypothetical protein